MTIVRNPEWLLHQPILKVDRALLGNLRTATGRSLLPIASLFEAYLQVVDLPIVTGETLRSPDCDRLIEGFVGALYSRRFLDAPLTTTYSRAVDFLDFIALSGASPSLKRQALSSGFVSPQVAGWRDAFELRALNEEQVWVKSGWGCTNKAHASICFPLFPIYERLGREFTQRFALVLEAWATGRRDTQVRVLADFCRYFAHYPDQISPSDLGDQYWSSRFLMQFGRYYFRENKARGSSVKTAVRGWNSTFIHVIKSLVAAGGLAQPEPPLAPITAVRVKSKASETNIRRTSDGIEVKTNMLTEVPLSASDTEAKELLFKSIQEDFAASVTWAERDADELWKRHMHAKAMAPLGTARLPRITSGTAGTVGLTRPNNVDCLANCAATYMHYGHPGPWRATYFSDIGLVSAAHMLGLPINGSLLPHASILVANYPAITSAFLDTLELYDREGRICGVVDTDAGKYLVGYKRRKGAVLSEQKILLNERAAEIVDQVIELTAPFRTYLRARGSDDWRYLFLTAQSVGAIPKRQRFSDQCSAPHKWGEHGLTQSFADRLGIPVAVAADLVRQFSLKNLRGSAAVLVYLQTGDAKKMAEALGHTLHNPKLLEYYLPKPLQRFFNSRWIRIFQAGIICQSLHDSPYLLEASGFKSMRELDEFLEKHAIRVIPDHLLCPDGQAAAAPIVGAGEEVVFSVSTGVLTMLLSIQMAVESATTRTSGIAAFWADTSKRLSAYIQSLIDRPDLLHCLVEARKHASPQLVAGLVGE